MRRSDPLELAHGRCVLVELDDTDDGADANDGFPLHPDEVTLAATLSPIRRRELIAGRTALRQALGQDVPVLPDDRGAPQLPAGWVGSISHKGLHAGALVAPAGDGFVGIDLELAQPSRRSIESRILTAREQSQIRDRREVTLYFAIKEAVYKAVDPIVRRYVGFTEVELEVSLDGTCMVRVLDAARLPVVIEASWQERGGLWLATARARPR